MKLLTISLPGRSEFSIVAQSPTEEG
jgi:hypothetical protein